MDNENYQDEFEQFLQDEVKQHRMYPSDHIWKNIRTELHGYKAWPALTFISLFIITALTISTLLINHPDKLLVSSSVSTIKQKEFIHQNKGVVSTSAIPENNYVQQLAAEQITAETFAGLTEYNPDQEASVINNTNVDRSPTTVRTELAATKLNVSEKFITKQLPSIPQQVIQNTLVSSSSLEKDENILYASNAAAESAEGGTDYASQTMKSESHGSADDFLKDFAHVATVTPAKKNSKFGFEFYITPSTSYRRLSDAKVKEIIQPAVAAAAGSSSQNIPLSSNYATSINDVVRHKPALGFELGFGFLYNMSNRLKFKTGVQLNIRQYYIETYQSVTNDLASLSLINYRGVETISFYSPYNNNTGYKQTQLDNKLYQVSVPIGIQWEMIQSKRFGITAEASIQPTLTLNTHTYLMSTDYKHYANGNDFIRKWNINSSLGLNLSYKTGSITWQLGPQFRYQHLPTYSNVYPIKENLMDYGIRLGFTKQIK